MKQGMLVILASFAICSYGKSYDFFGKEAVNSPHGSIPDGARAFSPDGKYYLQEIPQGTADGKKTYSYGVVGVFQVADDKEIRRFNIIPGWNPIKGFAWAHDSKTFAVMYHGGVKHGILIFELGKPEQIGIIDIKDFYHYLAFTKKPGEMACSIDGFDHELLEITFFEKGKEIAQKDAEKTDNKNSVALPKDIIPLAVGNTWVYSLSLEEGKDPFFRRILKMRDKTVVIATGRGFSDKPVKSTETYRITEKKENRYKVEISSKPEKAKESLRDCRYGDSKEIFWEIGKDDNSTSTSRMFFETIVFNREELSPGERERALDPIEERRPWCLMWGYATWSKESMLSLIMEDPYGVKKEFPNTSFFVKTPAGNFENCLEVREEVKAQKGAGPQEEVKKNDDPGKDPFKTGWLRLSYFAPEVGLVKEIQRNWAGDILYTMELLEYHIQNSEKEKPPEQKK